MPKIFDAAIEWIDLFEYCCLQIHGALGKKVYEYYSQNASLIVESEKNFVRNNDAYYENVLALRDLILSQTSMMKTKVYIRERCEIQKKELCMGDFRAIFPAFFASKGVLKQRDKAESVLIFGAQIISSFEDTRNDEKLFNHNEIPNSFKKDIDQIYLSLKDRNDEIELRYGKFFRDLTLKELTAFLEENKLARPEYKTRALWNMIKSDFSKDSSLLGE